MPAHMTRNDDGTYRVVTPNGVHSKHATKANAEAQVRLLNAIDHGFVPKYQAPGKRKSGEKQAH